MTGGTHTEGEAHREPRDDAEETHLTPQQRKGHDESLAAAHDLEQQVAQVEESEGHPIPSQPGSEETAGTGL